jgi:diguanylate cyclase (GGDEF)-like protein
MVSELAAYHVYTYPITLYWNALMRLGFFLVVGLSLVRIRCSMDSLEEMSRTDPLTKVANARRFQEEARREIEIAKRYRHPFTTAYVDLDNFKAVNDSLGHGTGDELLMRVAELIRGGMRKTDVLARLGGDEFVILFCQTGSEAAQTVMARIRDEISQEMSDKGWPVTLSVGLVTFISPPKSVDEMIQRADDLMYEAKTSGKNMVKSGTYPPDP